MEPPKYFLSYSRENIEELKIIAQTLRIHGIETWQDINNLGTGLTETNIRNAIQKCTGMVFYATEQSVQSLWFVK